MAPEASSFRGPFVLVAAEVEQPLTPETDTPPSDDALETPSLVEETPDSVTGSETPETEARQPDSYTLQELDGLYREGKLSDPALVERREGLQKADADRRREYARVTAEQAAAERARLESLANLQNETVETLRAERERILNRPLDPETQAELLAEREQAAVAKLVEASRDVHVAPVEANIRQVLLRAHGDTPRNRQALAERDLPLLLRDLWDTSYAMGQNAGPGEGKKVTDAKEWHKDGYHVSSYQKGLDDYKAANPGATPPRTADVRQAGTGLPSREQWTNGTYEQRQTWKRQYGDDVSDRIFTS